MALKFTSRLQENMDVQQAKRDSNLRKLHTITNSTHYRDGNGDLSEKSGIMQVLNKMVDEESFICREELRFIRRLGEGGFACVDLYERSNGQGSTVQYAVKEMKIKRQLPQVGFDETPKFERVPDAEVVKFHTEAVLLKSLRHKHVVGCYGCVRDVTTLADGSKPAPKLIQEFCPGGTLLDKLRTRKYTASDAFTWMHHIALGMQYLHDKGGIHRDLKPENILLKDNQAKVADFGLFRMQFSSMAGRAPESSQSSQSNPPNRRRSLHHIVQVAKRVPSSPDEPAAMPRSNSLTAIPGVRRGSSKGSPPMVRRNSSARMHTIVSLMTPSTKEVTRMTGTARYMAPECHELGAQETYTNKVDVFSFAIMMHEILCRKRAYSELERMTMDQVATAVNTRKLRPRLPKEWAPELRQLLERAWAQNSEDRPSFAELATEIEEMIKKAEGVEGGVAKLYGLNDGVVESCQCSLM